MMDKTKGAPVTLVLGTFDGVHRGHAALIAEAKRHEAPVVVVTFDRHPMAQIRGEAPPMLLQPELREKILRRLGADQVAVLSFDAAMAQLSPEAYVQMLGDRFAVQRIVVGYDHRFGHRAQGTPQTLAALGEQMGFDVICVPKVTQGDVAVSSTAIRRTVSEGRMAEANAMLGRAYLVSGRVAQGKQLGRKLGFPTLNVLLPQDMVCPERGVYTSAVYHKGRWLKAVTNVGVNPTVEGDIAVRSESFVFAEDGVPDYGDTVVLAFFEHLRPEQRFEGLEALQQAVQFDKKTAEMRHCEKEILYNAWLPW